MVLKAMCSLDFFFQFVICRRILEKITINVMVIYVCVWDGKIQHNSCQKLNKNLVVWSMCDWAISSLYNLCKCSYSLMSLHISAILLNDRHKCLFNMKYLSFSTLIITYIYQLILQFLYLSTYMILRFWSCSII